MVGKQLNQTCKRQKAIYFVYLLIFDRSAFLKSGFNGEDGPLMHAPPKPGARGKELGA